MSEQEQEKYRPKYERAGRQADLADSRMSKRPKVAQKKQRYTRVDEDEEDDGAGNEEEASGGKQAVSDLGWVLLEWLVMFWEKDQGEQSSGTGGIEHLGGEP